MRNIIEKSTGKTWDGRNTSGTPSQLERWLESAGFGATIVDTTQHMLWYYYPAKLSSNMCAVAKLMYTNGHVEIIENLDSFDQSATNKAAKLVREMPSYRRPAMKEVIGQRDLDTLVTRPSKHYPICSHYNFFEDGAELVHPSEVHSTIMARIMRMPEGDKSKAEKMVVYVQNSVDEFTGEKRGLKQLFLTHFEANIVPEIETKSGVNVTMLKFPWFEVPGRGKLQITLKVPCNTPGYLDTTVDSMEVLQQANDARAKFLGMLANKANLSYYTEEELLIMEAEKIPIPLGCVKKVASIPGAKIATMDRKKDYPTALASLPFLPVDTKFRRWGCYDGVIKDDYYYRVKIVKEFPLFPVTYTRMPAFLLKYVLEELPNEIPSLKGLVSVYEQKQLLTRPIGKVKHFVGQMLAEPPQREGPLSASESLKYPYYKIPEATRKSILVAPIGSTGRKWNKRRRTTVFKSKVDAWRFAKTVRGSCPIPVRPDGVDEWELDGCQIRDNESEEAYDDSDDGLDADSDYGSDAGSDYGESAVPRKKCSFILSQPACYFVTAIRQTLMTDGFRVIREFVMANSLLAMLKLYVMLVKDGIAVLAFKVDAIFFELPSNWASIRYKYDAMCSNQAGSYTMEEDLAGVGQTKVIEYMDTYLKDSVKTIVTQATEAAVMKDCMDASIEYSLERMREQEAAAM